MSLSTRLNVGLSAELASALDLASSTSSLEKGWQLNLATGTAANQADVLWHDERTLTASATEDLDLAGSLTGLLGGTVTFAKLKLLLVHALAANTNDVVLGNATSNGYTGPFGAATHTIAVKPGGIHVSYAPGTAGLGTVTAGTGDLLKVANSAGSTPVTYQIFVVGTSA